jgi:hypothetical protein
MMENSLKNYSRVPIKLPASNGPVGVLEANETTLIPVWIRADQSGKHTMRFLFVYHSKDAKEGESYRTLRITRTLDVHSSIRVTAFTRTSMVSMNEHILGLEITNIRAGSELIFRQLTSLSSNWNIKIIDDENITSKLKTNQTRHLYLKLTRRERSIESLHSTPEFLTTMALERLILAEDPKPWQPPPIELSLCTVAQVISIKLGWLHIGLSQGTIRAICTDLPHQN